MKTWEYKQIRLDYKDRGITQEISRLDVDGQRVRGWGSSGEVPTLPELLAALGADGWEMVSHVVNQDFDKPIRNYNKSPEAVNRKRATSRVHQRFIWLSFGSLVLTVITDGIGIIILIPVRITWMCYGGREWMS